MRYSNTAMIILMITALGSLDATEIPEPDPISIKGSNNFTRESINAVIEGQSLQLVCVVRDPSLSGISWLRDGVNLTYNGTMISQNNRYGIQVDATEKGRRFFRLSIRNISRIDSGNFTCTSLVPGIGSSVDIRVRFAPSFEYPMCSKELIPSDNTTEFGYTLMSCSTEKGVPHYNIKWFRNGIPQNASDGVSSEVDNDVFTSVIITGMNESLYLECRLFLKSVEVSGRRCCIGDDGECNNTANIVSQTTTTTNQETSTVTKAVDYYLDETTTDNMNDKTTLEVQSTTALHVPPGQTEELATTRLSQTTHIQDTIIVTEEVETLEYITDETVESPGNIHITNLTDMTEDNDITTYVDEVTNTYIYPYGFDDVTTRAVTDEMEYYDNEDTTETTLDVTTFEIQTSSPLPTTRARQNNDLATMLVTNNETHDMITDERPDLPKTVPITSSTISDDVVETEQNMFPSLSTSDASDATASSYDIMDTTESNDLMTYDPDSSNGIGVTTIDTYPDGLDDITSDLPDYVSTIETNTSSGNIGNRDDLNETKSNNEAVSGVSSLYATLYTFAVAFVSACMMF